MISDVEAAIRQYLSNVIHMSLGTSNGDQPWVCEVHFAYDDDLNIYFRSLTSRRHSQDIARNPKVAGNIVEQHDLTMKPRGVYFEGTAMLLEPGAEQQKAFECINARLQAGDSMLEEAQNPEGHQFYKVTVVKYYMFDSRDSKPSTKYELEWNGGKR